MKRNQFENVALYLQHTIQSVWLKTAVNFCFKTEKSLCNQHCGCVSRKRRSLADLTPFGLLIIDDKESDDIQSLEVLALAMIEVVEDAEPIQKQLSVFGNSPSRLRRSADDDNLNQLYSSITERLDEIDDLFEGSVSKF